MFQRLYIRTTQNRGGALMAKYYDVRAWLEGGGGFSMAGLFLAMAVLAAVYLITQ